MDKNIWLRVIKQELGLLEQLAIGMIDDVTLSREEAELAISRSKIVVKEFEMLLSQIPVPGTASESLRPSVVGSVHSPHSAVSESPSPQVPESPVPPVSPSPPRSTPEHELIQPSYDYFRLERDEHTLLNMDEKKDEPFHFKALPLKSLKEGLLLNDRYLFQRELFNDDKSRLDETIAALDRLSNIQEAVGYLKANFRWTRNEASEKFVQLVKRRFS